MRYRLLAALAALIVLSAGVAIVFAATAPNADCTTTERNAHSITGPDGGTYQTFAPQRHDLHPDGTTPTAAQNFGCFFGVEHGTNPRIVGIPVPAWPAYNSATVKSTEPSENQEGFKSVGFILDGKRVLYTLHRESGKGIAHTCLSFHETHISIADNTTGELLYRRTWLADYGPALYNNSNTNGYPRIAFRPKNCPNQEEDAEARGAHPSARRLEPVKDAPDGQPLVFYNPWQFAPIYASTGLDGMLTHYRNDATYACRYTGPLDWCAAETVVASGTMGTKARLLGWSVRTYATGQATGNFCTDPYGLAVQECGSSSSVRQYTKPGFDWDRRQPNSVECGEMYSENGRMYLCSPQARSTFQDFQAVNGNLKADKN